MMRGFTLSALLHASVIALAVMSWPTQKTECDKAIEKLKRDEPGLGPVDILMRLPECASAIDVPIEFLDIGLVTNVSAIPKAEVQEEAEPVPEEAPEEEAVPDDQPDLTPEEVDANDTRAEEPSEDDLVVEDEKAEPEPEPEPVKEPEKKKPEPKKEEKLVQKTKPKSETDDLDFLNDFEDVLKTKAQNERKAPPAQEPPRIEKPVLADAQQPRKGAGDRTGNTASLQAAVRRQIGYCWNGIDDLPKEDQINVVVRLKLARDGSLSNSADLVLPKSRPIGRAGIPVDLALRAVRKCAPYKLPADDYDQWKEIDVTIGPEN
ncbi:cell envelope integrity protein TolA [Hyphomonas oceanitis]|uniref:TonB family protein n=1 Tax=Hyphomonas oceanitis SCH89 TaxID=1280953 RepID=A0A059G863_9PROT|nr:cell envelope integrity protein TolA [Hyphomonas oceanitis]KDA02775.1 hypothetical protein HOC_08764 [Hyphomonas oceanitis SCH89]